MSKGARMAMVNAAERHNDTAAKLLAVEAADVWVQDDGEFALTVELEDVDIQLGWCPFDGWDGPSSTADTLAKMLLQERREFERTKEPGQ